MSKSAMERLDLGFQGCLDLQVLDLDGFGKDVTHTQNRV